MVKLAVTYDNEMIFQHFGKSENFKIYEIEDGKILSSKVVNTDGTGHEALAYLLKDMGVSVLVCGGLGDGAKAALNDAGIEIYAGNEGKCDEAAELYVKGELVAKEGHCDHHEEHEAEVCEGCDGDCESGNCGGCSGCHNQVMEGKNAGKIVKVHYRGTFDDGEQFDSSYDRGEPIEFICGTGMMIKGFDKAVLNMDLGESVDVHLEPGEAYGEVNPDAILTVEIAMLPGSENLEVGKDIVLTNTYGQNFPARVTDKTDTTITFDTNHRMAGKALNFHIELVEIK
ncbi:MAG: FKBP-type peptidyl-prolyl cis-trans isomerase [Erysipelotrichaceae bacterium]|nr:FKBP-type peptidyl-prolyl cis-trans isomerase [Erysipelotrichaceae bacterium]